MWAIWILCAIVVFGCWGIFKAIKWTLLKLTTPQKKTEEVAPPPPPKSLKPGELDSLLEFAPPIWEEDSKIFLNKAYRTYLNNQIRAHKAKNLECPTLLEKRKELNKLKRIADVRYEWVLRLNKMGCLIPEIMVTDYRIENYSPEDWQLAVSTANNLLETDNCSAAAHYFSEYVEDLKTLTSEDAYQEYKTLTKAKVSYRTAAMIVMGKLTTNDLHTIVDLVKAGATENDAVDTVINSKPKKRSTKKCSTSS